MKADYIQRIAREQDCNAAVFFFGERFRVLPVKDGKLDQMLPEFADSWMGCYTSNCPPEWIRDDMRYMIDREVARSKKR